MFKPVLHLVFVCVVSLGVIAQGFGASAGGVLCLGCTNTLAGVAVVNAACVESSGCCGGSTEHTTTSKSCDESQQSHPDDCGCVDVTLSHNIVVTIKTSTKSVLSLMHFAVAPVPVFVAEPTAVRLNSTGTREGPRLVRLLVPNERQTVLLL